MSPSACVETTSFLTHVVVIFLLSRNFKLTKTHMLEIVDLKDAKLCRSVTPDRFMQGTEINDLVNYTHKEIQNIKRNLNSGACFLHIYLSFQINSYNIS